MNRRLGKRKKRSMTNDQKTAADKGDQPSGNQAAQAERPESLPTGRAEANPMAENHDRATALKQSGWQHIRAYLREHTVALISLAASIAAVIYAYKQADIAGKALVIGQRAFVHLEKIEFGLTDKWSAPSECNGKICVFNIPLKVGQVERTTFYFTNAGNTPTRALKINIQCPPLSAADRHPADPFDLFNRTAGNIVERSIGAKQTIPVAPEACEYKDDDTILNAAMHTVRRFLLGEVIYEDWIEPGKSHVTRFAHERRLPLTAPSHGRPPKGGVPDQ
jgi:hypothetical protein